MFLVLACEKPAPTPTPPVTVVESTYENVQDRGLLENAQLDEASGLAAKSIKSQGICGHTMIQGTKIESFYLTPMERVNMNFTIQGAEDRDREDMAVVKESDGSATIYVADFGDNNAVYSSYAIYWFKEPVITGSTPALNTITQVNKESFTVSDGSRGCGPFAGGPNNRKTYSSSPSAKRKSIYIKFPPPIWYRFQHQKRNTHKP
jgi:hypothetical protein